METLYLGSHTIYVKAPKVGLRTKRNSAIFLNDGDLIIQQDISSMRAFLVGIVPNNRLSEYTPWVEKAMRPGAPDFGGTMNSYHNTLLTEIQPILEQEYKLDSSQLAYGGFSLGGLAAIMSLWQTERFDLVFSLCGSFWYPGVPEYMEQHAIKNKNANVFLLNGKNEGKRHTNCLRNASSSAQRVHYLLEKQSNAVTIMDDYAHHEQERERFQQVMSWIDRQWR